MTTIGWWDPATSYEQTGRMQAIRVERRAWPRFLVGMVVGWMLGFASFGVTLIILIEAAT